MGKNNLKEKYEGKYFISNGDYYYYIIEVLDDNQVKFIYLNVLTPYDASIKFTTRTLMLHTLTEISRDEFMKYCRNTINNILTELNEEL